MIVSVKSLRRWACFSRTRISIPARAGDAQYHPSRAAARDTACSPASGHLGRQGPGPQAIIVPVVPWILLFLSTYNWKLPPYDAGHDGTRVCFDELKFIPAVIDHEEAVSRQTERRNLDCVGTGAIRIHCICAGSGHCLNKSGVGLRRDDVAV